MDQLALEVHAALPFARAPSYAVALGRLAALASAAGLELAWAELTPCAPEHEALGCHQARALLLAQQCQGFMASSRVRFCVYCDIDAVRAGA